MDMRLTLKPDAIKDALPADKELLDAAAYGMEVCVRRHLREKNNGTQPNRHGLPKSNYYAEAASTVRSSVDGDTAAVDIGPDSPGGPGMGIALHFYGGTVFPKKKALAIPVSPAVAGIWPSEANALTDHIALIWPKNSEHGFLKDTETNELLWMLVPKATIPADPTVLPTDEEIAAAAENAILPLLEAS